MVNGKGRRPIRVRTVHSAQGPECRTVFFDPINGAEGLKHGVASARLINVAISRAQACLVISLSNGDLANSELGQVYEIVTGNKVPTVVVKGAPLYDLALQPGFPQSCLHELVGIPQINGAMLPGEIVEVATDQSWFSVKPSVGDRTPKKFILCLGP
jgi:DNA replication ATP-dependent helicase Dna2